MFSEYSYPIICTDKFARTVNFYEDHFGFVAVYELEGFAILKRRDWPGMHVAVMSSSHNAIPEAYRKNISGMILNMPVRDVDAAYDELYWEGVSLVSEPSDAACGRRHFFVEGPNGILIDVTENIDTAAMSEKITRCPVYVG
jgi:catechol 2,3-dioxygenase-like lactoylglutathione lyase family enzyme